MAKHEAGMIPMRLLLLLALVPVLLATRPAELRAQAVTRADSAAILLHAAERLRLQGDAAAARAVLQLISRDFAGTQAAAQAGPLLAALGRVRQPERSGRTELMVWGTTYGAWLGVALPLMLKADDPTPYGLGLLLGAPAGFLASRAYMSSRPVSDGQARAVTFGGSWGTWQGLGWAEVLDIGAGTERYCPPPEFNEPCAEWERDASTETRVAAAVAGGLAGIATGAILARKPISAGTAAAVSLGGLWGTWFGWGLTVLADAEGDAMLSGALLGGNAALVGTALAAPAWDISESRARLVSVAGLIGALGGAGTLLLLQPDDERTAVLIPMLTSAAGLLAGVHYTRNLDAQSPNEGGSGGGGAGALLNIEHGRLGAGVPEPSLRVVRPGSAAEYTLHVPLLRARF